MRGARLERQVSPASSTSRLPEPSGYGIAGKRCVLALARAGIPVTWTPMVGGCGARMHYGPWAGSSIGDPDLDRFCNRRIAYDTVIVHTVPEYFPFWIEAERGRTIIGHTAWETTAIPAHWPALAEFGRSSLCAVPLEQDRVCAMRCDCADRCRRAYRRRSRRIRRRRTDRHDGDGYVFYTIGVWSHRKAAVLHGESVLRGVHGG